MQLSMANILIKTCRIVSEWPRPIAGLAHLQAGPTSRNLLTLTSKNSESQEPGSLVVGRRHIHFAASSLLTVLLGCTVLRITAVDRSTHFTDLGRHVDVKAVSPAHLVKACCWYVFDALSSRGADFISTPQTHMLAESCEPSVLDIMLSRVREWRALSQVDD